MCFGVGFGVGFFSFQRKKIPHAASFFLFSALLLTGPLSGRAALLHFPEKLLGCFSPTLLSGGPKTGRGGLGVPPLAPRGCQRCSWGSFQDEAGTPQTTLLPPLSLTRAPGLEGAAGWGGHGEGHPALNLPLRPTSGPCSSPSTPSSRCRTSPTGRSSCTRGR